MYQHPSVGYLLPPGVLPYQQFQSRNTTPVKSYDRYRGRPSPRSERKRSPQRPKIRHRSRSAGRYSDERYGENVEKYGESETSERYGESRESRDRRRSPYQQRYSRRRSRSRSRSRGRREREQRSRSESRSPTPKRRRAGGALRKLEAASAEVTEQQPKPPFPESMVPAYKVLSLDQRISLKNTYQFPDNWVEPDLPEVSSAKKRLSMVEPEKPLAPPTVQSMYPTLDLATRNVMKQNYKFPDDWVEPELPQNPAVTDSEEQTQQPEGTSAPGKRSVKTGKKGKKTKKSTSSGNSSGNSSKRGSKSASRAQSPSRTSSKDLTKEESYAELVKKLEAEKKKNEELQQQMKEGNTDNVGANKSADTTTKRASTKQKPAGKKKVAAKPKKNIKSTPRKGTLRSSGTSDAAKTTQKGEDAEEETEEVETEAAESPGTPSKQAANIQPLEHEEIDDPENGMIQMQMVRSDFDHHIKHK